MAIYRFKVAFEDYDVNREIDMKSNHSFEDFHNAIHQSIGYKPDVPSSFYVSNDFWHKGQEITILPNQQRIDKKVKLMAEAKLHNFIEDPHQKFYFISNFERPFDFHIELVRILMDADPKLVYPAVIKSYGEAPKQFLPTPSMPVASTNTGIASDTGEDHLDEDDLDEDDLDGDDFAITSPSGLDDEESVHLREKEADDEHDSHDSLEDGLEDEEFDSGEEDGRRSGKEDDY